MLDAECKVLVFMAAANRDPRRWERADDYDITRPTAGHGTASTPILEGTP